MTRSSLELCGRVAHRALPAAAWLLIGCVSTFAAGQQPPRLSELSPRGLQVGGTTRLLVTGSGLDESTRVVLPLVPWPRVTVVSASGDRAELHVQLDDQYSPGIYPLRIATRAGISGAIAVGVDRLPQLEFGPSLVVPPLALYGQINGSEVLKTSFAAWAGSPLVVDLEARRLGSPLRPNLRLYAPSRRLIAVGRPSKQLGGDVRLDLRLSEDGIYQLELQDLVYQAAAASWFRLKIGQLQYADGVYPLAVGAALPAQLQLSATNFTDPVWFAPAAAGWLAEQPVTWPGMSTSMFTGAVPRVRVSWLGANEWTEEDARTQAGPLRTPLAINGRLSAVGEVDEYPVQVAAGSKLRFEVHAERWSSPLDALLTVTTGEGHSLGEADDQPDTTDPLLDLEIPAGMEQVRVRVASRVDEGGSERVYRLSIGPADAARPLLTSDLDGLNLPAGGRLVVPLRVDHRGTPRELQLSLPAALDDTVMVAPRRLAASDEIGLVCFRAAPTARGVFAATLVAQPMGPSPSPAVPVLAGSFPGAEFQPSWRDQWTIAVGEPAPLELDWRRDDGAAYLAAGSVRPLSVELQRRSGDSGPVRLSLISSQLPPLKQVEQRQEPDVDRTLRLAEAVVVPADASEATVRLIVPAELPQPEYAFALKAELLTADQQQVIAEAYTSIERRAVVVPLRVTLAGEAQVTVRTSDEAPLVLRGRLERHPELGQAVELRLEGLAEQDPKPTVTLGAGQSDFELTLKFATESAAREIKDVRVRAMVVGDSPAGQEIYARSAPITIQLTPQ